MQSVNVVACGTLQQSPTLIVATADFSMFDFQFVRQRQVEH